MWEGHLVGVAGTLSMLGFMGRGSIWSDGKGCAVVSWCCDCSV